MHNPESGFRDLLALFTRQYRLVVVAFVTIFGIATTVIFALTPIYSASTLILVEPFSRDLLQSQLPTGAPSALDARVNSEVEILRSDSILLAVVQEEKLFDDAEFSPQASIAERLLPSFNIPIPSLNKDEQQQTVLETFRKSVSIHRRGSTYLISIQTSSEKSARAAQLSNAIANVYIANQLKSKVTRILAERDILRLQADKANLSLSIAEHAYNSFIDNNPDRFLVGTARPVLAPLYEEFLKTTRQREQLQQHVTLIENRIAVADWVSVTQSLQSSDIQKLDHQRQLLTNNIATAPANSERAIDLRSQLAQILQSLNNAAQSELNGLHSAIENSLEQEELQKQGYRAMAIANLSRMPADVAADYFGIQLNAENARLEYQKLLKTIRELETQAELQIADSRIISPALAQIHPSFPNTKLFLIVAGISGLCFGLGLALLYENYVGGFISTEQLAAFLKTNVVSSIPLFAPKAPKNANELANSTSLSVLTAPMTAFAEAIRRIRASTDDDARLSSDNDKTPSSKVILVSSSQQGEGKTTIATSLARIYAQSGSSTLLIDCDLRKPSVHKYLGIDEESRFAEYLAAPDSPGAFGKIITKDPMSDLAVIAGSHSSTFPTDQIVAGKALANLIESASLRFEQIILDSPPIAPVVDGLYLARLADAIVFVVKWAETSQTSVRETFTALQQTGKQGKKISVVLNQEAINKRKYREMYSEYYAS